MIIKLNSHFHSVEKVVYIYVYVCMYMCICVFVYVCAYMCFVVHISFYNMVYVLQANDN